MQAQLGLGVGEALAVGDLLAVGVAHHVVLEHHAAHPRQLGAARLQGIAGPFESLFRPLLDLGLRLLGAGLVEPAVLPVSVRAQHGRQLAGPALGPVQVAANVIARVAGEEDLFDGVPVTVDLAVDDRTEGRLRRHRPQPFRHKHLFAEFLPPAFPAFPGSGDAHREVAVEVLRLPQPLVLRLLPGPQHPARLRTVCRRQGRGNSQDQNGDARRVLHGQVPAKNNDRQGRNVPSL